MLSMNSESLLAAIISDDRYSRLLSIYDMHIGMAGGIQEKIWEVENSGEWLSKTEWQLLLATKMKVDALAAELLASIAILYEMENQEKALSNKS